MNDTAVEPIIEIKNLTKVFYAEDVETHALSNIQFSVRQGEYVALVGPSGSGKSTLLGILGLLDKPSHGQYRLSGSEVARLEEADLARLRNQHIGFIFQTFNLIGDLTVYANVELPLIYRGIPREERRDRVQDALKRVDMTHRSRHMPGQLSGGQQQRVAVARALVGNPSILLADEPTGNLDSNNGEMVMELISELHQAGCTICMVTHDARFALRASRRVRLSDGCIVEELS
jgi:putative ABC transport system ATP-binding protein